MKTMGKDVYVVMFILFYHLFWNHSPSTALFDFRYV